VPAPICLANESNSPLKSGGPALVAPVGRNYCVAKCNRPEGRSIAICATAGPRVMAPASAPARHPASRLRSAP
jgi:hypothetical protein